MRSTSGVPEVPPPEKEEAADASRQFDAMAIFQSLIEIQKDIATNTTKIDRLIKDVEKLDTKVDTVSHAIWLAKGFGLAAVILIPICAAVIWWLIGAQLEHLRDQLLEASKPPVVQSVPTSRP